MSPLLFDLYINDILVKITMERRVKIRAYADDIIILADDLHDLQEALEQLFQFC